MTEIGLFLSTEEHDGLATVQIARQAERAGIDRVWVSDHYHPWTDRQGNSPFVWSVLGALAATTDLRIGTAVTCPTTRIHPAVVAQAAASTAAMMPDRFSFGVGSGEALNEQILGDPWPPATVRLEMLAEAIDLIRSLWEGHLVTWRGRHYKVTGARLYTLPDRPPPILVSAFGDRALDLAVSHGDGLITTKPDEKGLTRFRAEGSGPVCASVKLCWHPDEQVARRTAWELWGHAGLPGQLGQELSLPSLFEDATELVTEERVSEMFACGPDPDRHLDALRPFLDAGFDELYIHQIGPDQEGFLRFYRDELAPRL